MGKSWKHMLLVLAVPHQRSTTRTSLSPTKAVVLWMVLAAVVVAVTAAVMAY